MMTDDGDWPPLSTNDDDDGGGGAIEGHLPSTHHSFTSSSSPSSKHRVTPTMVGDDDDDDDDDMPLSNDGVGGGGSSADVDDVDTTVGSGILSHFVMATDDDARHALQQQRQQRCAAMLSSSSASSSPASSPLTYYAVSRTWMEHFLRYDYRHGDALDCGGPGAIENASLLLAGGSKLMKEEGSDTQQARLKGGDAAAAAVVVTAPNNGLLMEDYDDDGPLASAYCDRAPSDAAVVFAMSTDGERKNDGKDNDNDGTDAWDDSDEVDAEARERRRSLRRQMWREREANHRHEQGGGPQESEAAVLVNAPAAADGTNETMGVQLRPNLVHGVDYLLVGEKTWNMLSCKFDCDVAVPFRTVARPDRNGGSDLDDGENDENKPQRTALAVEVYPEEPSLVVAIPPSGKWDYDELLNNARGSDKAAAGKTATIEQQGGGENDVVSDEATTTEEDDQTDDLFPSLDPDESITYPTNEEESSPPVLLLPPSTTATTATSSSSSCSRQFALVSLETTAEHNRRGSYASVTSNSGIYPDVNDMNDDLEYNPDDPASSSSAAIVSSGVVVASTAEVDDAIVTTVTQQQPRRRCGAGLGNLGNTCFMNSTLQCLGHTQPLRQYFLNGKYEDDLNRDNPLGTGGELASEFAGLLSQMWGTKVKKRNQWDSGRSNGTGGVHHHNLYGSSRVGNGGGGLYGGGSSSSAYDSLVVYPRNFKYTLGRHAEQFMGYDQHDSQELASYLLDALHEDTNRVTKKPYVEKPEQGEHETDDDAADKAWSLHLKRENSRVNEMFMGQVKSRLQCPTEGCGRVSTTFDPVMYLSVPIPGATDRTVNVTYVPLNGNERMKQLSVTLSKMSTVAALRKKIADAVREYGWDGGRGAVAGNNGQQAEEVCPEDIVLADVWGGDVYTMFEPDDEIDKIRPADATFAYHVRSASSIREEEPDGDALEDNDDVANDASQDDLMQLDEATAKELSEGDEWQRRLEPYVKQQRQLDMMFNVRRSSHEERESFAERLERFVKSLKRCSDAVPQGPPAPADTSDEVDAVMSISGTASDGDKKEAFDGDIVMDENTTDGQTSSVATPQDFSAPSRVISDEAGLSLAEQSEMSRAFQGVSTPRDLAILNFCTDKFREFIENAAKEKENMYKDGVVIRVAFKRHTSSSTSAVTYHSSSSDKTFAQPLVLRISPRLTVYGLRELLAERLSRSIKVEEDDCVKAEALPVYERSDECLADRFDMESDRSPSNACQEEDSTEDAGHISKTELGTNKERHENGDNNIDMVIEGDQQEMNADGSPELCVMRQIPMTYDKKPKYYSAHRSPKILGSLSVPEDDTGRSVAFASATDEAEGGLLADLVGENGSVFLHWPEALMRRVLDEDELEKVEEAKVPPAEEEENAKKKQALTIVECISKYCQMEQLEESEIWYCSRCKQHVRAWKQLHIYRAPPILIVHLKRFHFSASTHRRDKIDTFIDFPLNNLDLSDEVTHWNEGEEPIYDCYAVSNHFGGLGGGHYTAYALDDDGEWCNFDDSRVTKGVSENEVVSAAAYCLYYKRRDVKVEENLSLDLPMPEVIENDAEESSSQPSPIVGTSLEQRPFAGELRARFDAGIGTANTDGPCDGDADVMSSSSRTCSSPIDPIDCEQMQESSSPSFSEQELQ